MVALGQQTRHNKNTKTYKNNPRTVFSVLKVKTTYLPKPVMLDLRKLGFAVVAVLVRHLRIQTFQLHGSKPQNSQNTLVQQTWLHGYNIGLWRANFP